MNAQTTDSFNRMVELSNRAFARRRSLAKAHLESAEPRSLTPPSLSQPPTKRASAFDDVPAALLIGDMEGNLLDANQAGSSLLGYSPSLLSEMTVLDLVAARPEWTHLELGRFRRDGFWRGDVLCRRPDGSVVEVAALAKRADVAGGSSFVAILQEISHGADDSDYGDRLQRTTLDLTSAPSTMAAIATAVRRGSAGATIQRNESPLDTELNDILALTSLDHRRLKLSRREADFAELVDLSVEEARRLSPNYRITLSQPRGAMPGMWDVNRVTKIMSKLLNEAARHSIRGGAVHVTATESEAEVIFGVTVDQCLTKRQVTSTALQPLDNSFSERSGSLYLSRLLIEEHGGRIWADGTHRNDAAAVYFALPRWPGHASASLASAGG